MRQLQLLGEQVGVPVFAEEGTSDPVSVAGNALAHARAEGFSDLIVDTAGRMHVDPELMAELGNVSKILDPTEILLVCDAMTGQDAVNVAESFMAEVDITGVILTKLDGDARGGAALSMAFVTGRPIKFAGVGEKLGDLEPFHPDRMVSRILGMGDVLTLIEKAESAFDEAEAEEMEAKLRKAEFTFDDFLGQLQALRKMGPMSQVLGMVPGMSKLPIAGDEVEAQLPTHRGHDPLDDRPGARGAGDHQGKSPGPHRAGLGHLSPGSEQTREAVRRRQEDDEDDVGRQRWAAAPPQGLQAPTRSGHLTC